MRALKGEEVHPGRGRARSSTSRPQDKYTCVVHARRRAADPDGALDLAQPARSRRAFAQVHRSTRRQPELRGLRRGATWAGASSCA
ncbi:MAG: hypothetical protein MZW92_12105 [Comamonadaceae bacterium]|nr:hypothetical protein [Comamonadaceae bacterium]